MVLDNYYYYGEMDSEGNACGEGLAINADDKSFKYRGTFINNLPEGVCKSAFPINDLCGSQALRSMKTNVKVKVSIEQVSGMANGPTVISSKYLKTMLIISDQL